MTNKMLLFDFDGVVLDSFDAAFAVNKLIHPLITEDFYRKRFEGNINEKITDEAINREYHPEIDYFTEYAPRISSCKIFDGMKEVIEEISKISKLIIISSTNTDLIQKSLATQGLDTCFTEILGNDVHKSKIAKIEMVLHKYETVPDNCIFITDTLGDIKEADHHGIKAIAVSWGYQSAETLQRGNPSRIVRKPSELLDELLSFAGKGTESV